ncbi:hypothetical protein [Undibacterium pigrum]|uniref:Uncharacterized protein n=1 Tax=Undibacterium pigrum TaxID=401470 RepID=A0A318J5N1_9BURK|nr:hypothetical protein [Undibacterium pigrum]PXX41667.1 hypothetical protein DFR42_107319 [Undibacterium pigrum]
MVNFQRIFGEDGLPYLIDTSNEGANESYFPWSTGNDDLELRSDPPPFSRGMGIDFGYGQDMARFREFRPERLELTGAISDPGELAKSDFLRAEKTGYRDGDFARRDSGFSNDAPVFMQELKNFGDARSLDRYLGGPGDVGSTRELKFNGMITQARIDPGFTQKIRAKQGLLGRISARLGLNDEPEEVVMSYALPKASKYSDLNAKRNPSTRNLEDDIKKNDFYKNAEEQCVPIGVYSAGITNSPLQSYSMGRSLAEELELQGTPYIMTNAYNATHGKVRDGIESALEKMGMTSNAEIGTRLAIEEAIAHNKKLKACWGDDVKTKVFGHSQGTIIANKAVGALDDDQRANVDLVNLAPATAYVPAGLNSFNGVGNINDTVYRNFGRNFMTSGGIQASDNFKKSNLQRPGSYQFHEVNFRVARDGQLLKDNANHSLPYYLCNSETRQKLRWPQLTDEQEADCRLAPWVDTE